MKSLLVTLLLASTVFAQGLKSDRGNFQVMYVFANANMAKVSFNDSDAADAIDTPMKFGFGLGVETAVGPVNLAVGYDQWGSGYEMELGGIKFDGYDRLNYLTIKALLPYSFTSQFAALAGMGMGYSLGGEMDFDGTTDDIKGEDVNFDFGAIFGAEFVVNPKMTVRATYYWGLSDISADAAGDDNWKNRVITATLLYRVK
jgi:opacity protein-like surface antigen